MAIFLFSLNTFIQITEQILDITVTFYEGKRNSYRWHTVNDHRLLKGNSYLYLNPLSSLIIVGDIVMALLFLIFPFALFLEQSSYCT